MVVETVKEMRLLVGDGNGSKGASLSHTVSRTEEQCFQRTGRTFDEASRASGDVTVTQWASRTQS